MLDQIDTGVDLLHPDIQANLWINPGEQRGPGANSGNGFQNGVDDDGNGESRARDGDEHHERGMQCTNHAQDSMSTARVRQARQICDNAVPVIKLAAILEQPSWDIQHA